MTIIDFKTLYLYVGRSEKNKLNDEDDLIFKMHGCTVISCVRRRSGAFLIRLTVKGCFYLSMYINCLYFF